MYKFEFDYLVDLPLEVAIENDRKKLDKIIYALNVIEDHSEHVDIYNGVYKSLELGLEAAGIPLDAYEEEVAYLAGNEGIVSSIAKGTKNVGKKVLELIKKLVTAAIDIAVKLKNTLKGLSMKLVAFLTTLFKDFENIDTSNIPQKSFVPDEDDLKRIATQIGGLAVLTGNDTNGKVMPLLIERLKSNDHIKPARESLRLLNKSIVNLIFKPETRVERNFSKSTKYSKNVIKYFKSGIASSVIHDKVDHAISTGHQAVTLIDNRTIKFITFKVAKDFKSTTGSLSTSKGDKEKFKITISKGIVDRWLKDTITNANAYNASDHMDMVTGSINDTISVLNALKKSKDKKFVSMAVKLNKTFNDIMYEDFKSTIRAYKGLYDTFKVLESIEETGE